MRARGILIMGIVVALVAATVGAVLVRAGGSDPEVKIRWDILNVDFTTGTISPGGFASARASDNSEITLTGSGTFVVPAGGGGTDSAVTGGGTWKTFNATDVPKGSGTYAVTGLVRWQMAPGTPPLNIKHDAIGNPADSRAGLVVLRVSYDDGSRGVLVVRCHLMGTPNPVFEGVTASKGFVDLWNREAPVPLVNGDRTNFHILPEGGD